MLALTMRNHLTSRAIALLTAISISLASTPGHAVVTIDLTVETQGEPIPGVEISLETDDGELIELTELIEVPESVEQPPQTETPTPTETVQPPQIETAAPPETVVPPREDEGTEETPTVVVEQEPKETFTPEQREEPTQTVTSITVNDEGKASFTVPEEFRDETAILVVRKDGEVIDRQEIALVGGPLVTDVPSTQLPEPQQQVLTSPDPTPASTPPTETPPVAERFVIPSGPAETVEAQPESVPANDFGLSVSLGPKIGVIDRSSVNLPIRLQVEGETGLEVTETFSADRDSETAAGVTTSIFYRTPGLFSGFGVAFDYLDSDTSDTIAGRSVSGVDIGALFPQGSGAFVSGADGEASFSDITYKSDYDEGLVRPGVEFTLINRPSFRYVSRLGGLFGWTDETSSTTYRLNGFADFNYSDEIEVDRYGGYFGSRIEYFPRNDLKLFLETEVRIVENDASGRSSLTTNFGECLEGCRQELDASDTDVGFKIGVGLEANPSDRLGIQVGAEYETWEIAVRDYAVGETGTSPVPTSLSFEDRDSFTFYSALKLRFLPVSR